MWHEDRLFDLYGKSAQSSTDALLFMSLLLLPVRTATRGLSFVARAERGICVPGFGGSRHSDTVIVTKEGPELATNFPRDLKSLTVKA
jgi:hypothetical protein